MPIGAFKNIREVSSEDETNSSENLLKQQPGKKWKTKSVGEKSAYVVLEFDEPQKITGIDIGNEHSAFVEVLVGKATCSNNDFSDILITSSFMTPTESKNSTNINRVRCFNHEALVPSALDTKWKFVKVVCTQPFNKHVQYGLSFIKVHVAETKSISKTEEKCLVPKKFLLEKNVQTPNTNASAKPFTLGKFHLREESPDSESESTNALFKRWKTSHNNTNDLTPSTAAQIREASKPSGLRRLSRDKCFTLASTSMHSTSISKTPELKDTVKTIDKPLIDRNREQLLFGDDDGNSDRENADKKQQRLMKQIQLDKNSLRVDSEKRKTDKDKRHQQHTTTKPIEKQDNQKATVAASSSQRKELHDQNSSSTPNSHSKKRISSSPCSSSSSSVSKKLKPSELKVQFRPLNQLLRGVVLVISGIQNPDRANIRNKALALGAKYKTDWENSCTHLICAFKNTPKYNQVKGKGKIVTRSWIEKCYESKKYLPWRRFALVSSELAKPESDEEIWDESLRPQTKPTTTTSAATEKNNTLAMYDLCGDDDDDSVRPQVQNQSNKPTTSAASEKNNTLAMYDVDNNGHLAHNVSSGSDTEDEIERVLAKKNSPKGIYAAVSNDSSKKDRDIYEATTEEEDFLKAKQAKHKKFLCDTKCYLCSDLSDVVKIKLQNFIESFGGSLTTDLSQAQFAISENVLTKVDAGKFTGELVRPLWIYECNDMEVRVPTNRYRVK